VIWVPASLQIIRNAILANSASANFLFSTKRLSKYLNETREIAICKIGIFKVISLPLKNSLIRVLQLW
jgi:hypothetical protein